MFGKYRTHGRALSNVHDEFSPDIQELMKEPSKILHITICTPTREREGWI